MQLKKVRRPAFKDKQQLVIEYIENNKVPSWLIAINDGRIYSTNAWTDNLVKLRKEAKALFEQGKAITSHYARLEREYSDFEDRLQLLDAAIEQMEHDTGIPKKAIYQEIAAPQHTSEEVSVLDDFLDSLDETPKPHKEEKSIFDDFL